MMSTLFLSLVLQPVWALHQSQSASVVPITSKKVAAAAGEMTSVPIARVPLAEAPSSIEFGIEGSESSTILHSRQLDGTGKSSTLFQTPSLVMKATYEYSQNQTAFAHFNLYTKLPSVNLDSYKSSIRFITCQQQGAISVLFADSDLAYAAYQAWSSKSVNDTADPAAPRLALFLGHETQCLGLRSVHMANVLSMNLQGRILNFKTEALQPSDLIQGYDLHMRQIGADPSKKSTDSNTKGKKFSHDLNFNYDPITKKIKSPEMRLLSDEFAVHNAWTNVTCFNCYTNGSISVEFKLKAKFLKIQEYSLKVDGNLIVNMDLGVNTTIRQGTTLLNYTLVDLPLGPLVIPGLFECGPAFQIKTGISASMREYANFKMGFDMDLPLSMSLQHTAGSPQVQENKVPHLNAHALEYPKSLPVQSISASITPQVSIKVQLFDFSPLGLSLGFSNALGVDFVPQKLAACARDVSLYHSHMLSLDADLYPMSYHKTFWYSGRTPIPCPFCKCNKLKSLPFFA